MTRKLVLLFASMFVLGMALGIWACGSSGSSSKSANVDDDTSPADDDTSPTDDDASPSDDDVSPTDDDASPADDDDDSSPVATWVDPATNLMWQVFPAGERDWPSAVAYCNNLGLGGFGNWHLPSVSELRSLVQNCAATEVAGSCGVTDACRTKGCRNSACDGCAALGGPGANGCYWSPALAGDCSRHYWSADPVQDQNTAAWEMAFDVAGVFAQIKTATNFHVRCVRTQ